MIDIILGSTVKPVSSNQLVEKLSSDEDLEGTLYIGYPIIGTPEGPFPIDALLVSPQKGLVLFNLIEGREVGEYGDNQDETFNKMQAKLLQHQTLTQKRKLRFDIHTVTFAPVVTNLTDYIEEDYPLCNAETLNDTIAELDQQNEDIFTPLVAVIQAISTLRRGRRKRDLRKPHSKGTKLKTLEDSIANLDMQQSAAVIETFEGVQRIRGLAGSGKTIVLALKVAYLHASHPDWDIAALHSIPGLLKSNLRT